MSSFQALKGQRAVRQSVGHGVDRSASVPSKLSRSEQLDMGDNAASAARSTLEDRNSAKESGSFRQLSTHASGSAEASTRENVAFGMDKHALRIEKRAGRGRGLFSARAVKPGDTILPIDVRPPASTLSTPNLTSHCSSCFLSARDAATLRRQEETPLKRCSACRVAHYCSSACSKDDWPFHKPECTAFQALRKKYKEKMGGMTAGSLDFIPYESVRALGRLLWTKKRAKDAGQACPAWDEFSLLQSRKLDHLDSRGDVSDRPEIDPEGGNIEKLRHESYRLAFYVGLTTPHILEAGGEAGLSLLMKEYGVEGNPELELMKTWSRYQTNAFTLDSPDLSAMGVVVAPALAMANHSCEPNAVVVFPQGQAKGRIMAIRPIEADAEVLVCYIDVASPRAVRQADLSSRYGFTCDCNLCMQDSGDRWVDPRWCLLHPDCTSKGKGRMIPSVTWDSIAAVSWTSGQETSRRPERTISAARCERCNEAFSVDEADLLDLLGRAKGLLAADEKGVIDSPSSEPLSAARAAQEIVARLSRLCPPSAHPLIPLNRLITRLLTLDPPTSLQALSVPLYHLNLALEGARVVYAPLHPTLAILQAQKARLLGIQFPPTAQEADAGRAPANMRNEIHRMQAATLAYREAVKACAGSFGLDGGIVGLGLRADMESLEMEMRAMRLGAETAQRV